MESKLAGSLGAISLLLLSCTGDSPSLSDRVYQNDVDQHLYLEWRFEATAEEEEFVLQAVSELMASPFSPDRGAVGMIYRFARPAQTGRYLLLTFGPEADDLDGRRPAVLYALLADGESMFSEPLRIGTDTLGGFGVEEIGDFDGDSLPDVAYCPVPGSENAPHRTALFGMRDQHWYAIEDAEPERKPECP